MVPLVGNGLGPLTVAPEAATLARPTVPFVAYEAAPLAIAAIIQVVDQALCGFDLITCAPAQAAFSDRFKTPP
jgi:hypothetical protein